MMATEWIRYPATEGDSPVREPIISLQELPSNIGHVKSGMNLGRPRSKAKYFCTPIAHSTARER